MFDYPPPLMSQFHIQQILGFGPDPLPPFGTMSLNPFFLGGAPTSISGFSVRTYVPNVRPKLILDVRPKISYCLSYLYVA